MMPVPSARPNCTGSTGHYGPGGALRLPVFAALASLLVGAGGPDALNAQQAGAGPSRDCCRELHYLYEATILQIDVMRLQVRVDQATAAAAETAARSAPRSSRLEHEVARHYLAAREATLDMEFLHGVSGETFLEHTLKALRELVADGTVTRAGADTLARELNERFGFLVAAKVRPGDQLRYELVADTVLTTYRRGDTVLKAERATGKRHRDYILGSYFAPSSDFRRGLLDQVFRP